MDADPIDVEDSAETVVDPNMAAYMNAISKSIKK